MKLFFALIMVIVISGIAQLCLPWWIIAPIAFAVCYLLKLKTGEAFLVSFLSIFILWAGYAYYMDMRNEHILCKKVAALLHLSLPPLILLITGLVGGLVAGFAGLASGFLVKR